MVRHAFDHMAAAQVMLTHSWLSITFFALRTPAHIQHFVCNGQCSRRIKFVAAVFAEMHDLFKF